MQRKAENILFGRSWKLHFLLDKLSTLKYLFDEFLILSAQTHHLLLVLFSLLRYSSIFRKQFRLSSRWQSSTLAKIPSGPHRDGRPHCPSVTNPPQRPLQHTDPSAQSQLESLPSSFKPFQLSLPPPRLSDSLQTPQQNPHRFITEFNTGPPLGKEGNPLENAGFAPPLFSPSQPTHSSLLISYVLKNPVPDQFFFSPYPQMQCDHRVINHLSFLIVNVSVDPTFKWHCWMFSKNAFLRRKKKNQRAVLKLRKLLFVCCA